MRYPFTSALFIAHAIMKMKYLFYKFSGDKSQTFQSSKGEITLLLICRGFLHPLTSYKCRLADAAYKNGMLVIKA